MSRRGTEHVRSPFASTVRLAAAATTMLLGLVVGTSNVVAAAPAALGLVAQTFNVDVTGTIDITVSIPTGVTFPVADFTITLTAFRPVSTRSAVTDAIAGNLPRAVDSVDVPAALVSHPNPEQLRVSVPVESTTRGPLALQLAKPGIYPVLVELHQGAGVVADLQTFVHRVPTAQEGEELSMPVALAAATRTAVQLDERARVTLGDDAIREMTSLANLLEASAVPVAIRVPPSLLAELANHGADGAALADRLSRAMQRNDLLSAPVLPLDPSAAAAAGQQGLYTQWLRDGEDSLAKSAAVAAKRTITLVDGPLSEAGGVLLRDLGTRLLVLPASLYDGLPNSLGVFTDSTQLVQVQVSPGVTLDATIVDRIASRVLSSATTTPQLSAIQAVSDLLAARQQVEDQGGDPRRHSVTLATPDLSLPTFAGFAAFTTLLADTKGLRPTTLDDLSVRTDQLLSADGPVVVNLPTKVEGSIAGRIALTSSLDLGAASTASMLPSDDTRAAEWTRLIDSLPSSALSDTTANAIANDLRSQFHALQSAVSVPAAFSFNLTGQRGTVPLSLHNSSDIALKVRVRLSSSKLLFPGGDQTVTLEPDSFTHIRIAIDARSNGDFPVALDVFTPLSDTKLIPSVALTASINAWSGVGTLVTLAALLVLLTWWIRHIRRNHRGRHVSDAADRHPATRPSGLADDTALSPDAETSTLPPS